MEDLDIIRHDIQPGRMHPGLQPGLQHGLQPGRRPGCRARPRNRVGRPAKVGRGLSRSSAKVGRRLSRSSESPRPGFEARGRAAEYN